MIGVVTLSLLLDPADFSLYGYVNTVVLAAAAVGDLGLGANLIRRTASDRDLSGSLALQLTFWVPIMAIALGLGMIFHPFGFSNLTIALLLVAMFLLSLQALPTALLEKRMAFKRISAIEVVQRVVLVLAAVTMAALHPTEWSIPLAAAVAAAIGYPTFLLAAGWRWRPRFTPGEPLFRGFSSQWWQVRILNQAAYAVYPLLGGILYTADQVGLIVWAIAITSIPAYLAPMVSRAVFPALARTEGEQMTAVYSELFRGLLLISLPLLAVLFVCARPITEHIFGDAWANGIPLLRLESITTIVGLALTPIIPLLFLVFRPHRIKWLMLSATIGLIAASIALTPLFSYKAISIATIAYGLALIAVIDWRLRVQVRFSPLRDMLPGLTGLTAAIAVGLPLIDSFASIPEAIAIAILVAAVQLSVTLLLKGGVDLRDMVRRVRTK